MAADTPDALDFDAQDTAEVFDETNLTEDDAEFVTLEEMPDVFDATQALGDGRDLMALDAGELDPESLDDEDLETDEDIDDRLRDELEDITDDEDIDAEDLDEEDAVNQLEWDEADVESVADVDQITDPDDEEADEYESAELSDEDLAELGYGATGDKDGDKDGKGPTTPSPDVTGPTAEDVEDDTDPHQEDLLDEGVEETFPASDPVSVKRIT